MFIPLTDPFWGIYVYFLYSNDTVTERIILTLFKPDNNVSIASVLAGQSQGDEEIID